MEILRIMSLAFLLIVDLVLISIYISINNKKDKNVILVILTIFIIPTLYIILK